MYPVLFSFGPIRLYSYGLLVALGVLLAVLLLRINARGTSVHPDTVVDLAIVTVIGGFAMARAFYVVQFWNYFRNAPLDIFKMWQGGIILYGGLVGGILGFTFFIWVRHLPFMTLLDLFVPATALAQAFGRIGCFLNGCCFGKASQVPWAVSFPFLKEPVHPTQLYEAFYCFLLTGLLLFLWNRRFRTGTVAAAYFILYPMGRFVIEFFRGDSQVILFHLTLNQWISFGFVLFVLILLVFTRFIWPWKKST
ncbi:MAG: prolipoprotein diacylglyceryl transferase [Candidatus Omnitrophica bacterium]|nr:prolipoprotein diacylglyceryl transferase [Candidatus Omnitrophota bacterium]